MPGSIDILSDQLLLAKVSEGNESAFHELVNRYAHVLYTFIYRIINDRQKTEELVQDSFIKIWLTREHLATVNNFKAYLFVVSKNFAIKATQKALRERQNFSEWIRSLNTEQVDNEWKFAMIDEAIQQLPPQQYKVWMMSRRQGMKYNEIAKELGLSRESVKKYLQFANASIMEYIKNRLELMVIIAIYLNS
mgnify:CR=1 FL=1